LRGLWNSGRSCVTWSLAHSLPFLILAASIGAAGESGTITREQTWVAEAGAGLDPRALQTLSRIQGPNRQLLALRAYLRVGDSLATRWSWSQAQLSAYPGTPEGVAAAHDIDAVEAAFAAANPGFTARANRMPRSLELQLEHWNDSRAVAALGAELAAALERQWSSKATPSVEQIRTALMEWSPRTAAPLAAPGLSAHGQGRAFDFQIEHDGQTIAGFDATAARQQWDRKGWTRKLHAAVAASGKPFSGPLQSPYEPWHYAYAPASAH
jgi:hypothetical protein